MSKVTPSDAWIGPTPFSGSWQRCVLVGWQTGDIGSSSCRCRVADVNNSLTSFVHNHSFHTNTLVEKRFPRHLGKFSCTCLPSVSIHKGDGGWGGGGGGEKERKMERRETGGTEAYSAQVRLVREKGNERGEEKSEKKGSTDNVYNQHTHQKISLLFTEWEKTGIQDLF